MSETHRSSRTPPHPKKSVKEASIRRRFSSASLTDTDILNLEHLEAEFYLKTTQMNLAAAFARIVPGTYSSKRELISA